MKSALCCSHDGDQSPYMSDRRTAPVASNVEVLARARRQVGDRGISDAGAGDLATVLGGVIGGVAVDVGVVQDVKDGEILPRCQGRQRCSHIHECPSVYVPRRV